MENSAGLRRRGHYSALSDRCTRWAGRLPFSRFHSGLDDSADKTMRPSIYLAIRAQRSEIKARWTRLLQIEPPNTALGHPDTLVYLIDGTFDAVLASVHAIPPGELPASKCDCGRNPFLAYFSSARQSLFEALVLAHWHEGALDRAERERDVLVLHYALCQVIGNYAQSFSLICRHCTAVQDRSPLPDPSLLQKSG
jgi:hypothetical protein